MGCRTDGLHLGRPTIDPNSPTCQGEPWRAGTHAQTGNVSRVGQPVARPARCAPGARGPRRAPRGQARRRGRNRPPPPIRVGANGLLPGSAPSTWSPMRWLSGCPPRRVEDRWLVRTDVSICCGGAALSALSLGSPVRDSAFIRWSWSGWVNRRRSRRPLAAAGRGVCELSGLLRAGTASGDHECLAVRVAVARERILTGRGRSAS